MFECVSSVNNNAKYALIVKEVVAQLRAEERAARGREALRARSRGSGPDEERFRESNVDIAYYSDELFERGLDMFDKLIDGSGGEKYPILPFTGGISYRFSMGCQKYF